VDAGRAGPLTSGTRLRPPRHRLSRRAVPYLLAADRFRSLGHDVVAGRLVARRGSLVRRRCALSCDAVIGWAIEETWFQRRAGLATLRATTAAGAQRYDVQDIEAGAAVGIAEQMVPGLLAPFRA
jgi:putative membrane protein